MLPSLRRLGPGRGLVVGPQTGRYTLSELGRLVGGLDYAAVGQAVSRFGKRVQKIAELRRNLGKIERKLSNVEM